VLFADHTSAILTANKLNDLQTKSVSMLIQKHDWFRVNGLSLYTDKTNVIHFKSNHLQANTFQISYQGEEIKEVINTKILGLGLEIV